MSVAEKRMLIGGRWVPGESGERFESIRPYDQRPWASLPLAGPSDVGAAIAAARDAFGEWRSMTGLRRADSLYRLAELLEARADHLATLESIDTGKVIRETSVQVRFAARLYRYYAGWADKLHGEVIPVDAASTLDYALREPLGVVGLITAWNSPLPLLAYKLAPALAAGNAAVVKPSEHASVTTLELAGLVAEAGFPDGVVNVVTGDGTVGELLTRSPGLDKISFTGGPETGRRIAANAAESLTPVTLELGGKSPNIVFDDCDVERAVTGALAGIFGAAGQTCIAGSRLLVQRGVYDAMVERLAKRADAIRLGDPLSRDTEMGPVATAAQRERIQRFIELGRESGARRVAGDRDLSGPETASGLFVAPTIFADVDNGAPIAREEIFGPVLSIIPFEEEDEAVAIANDSEYGLAGGIWTRHIARAHRVAAALDAGTVWINTYRVTMAQAPFGGTKGSGYGRERGLAGLLEYTRVKNVMADLTEDVRDPFAIATGGS